MRLSIYTWIVGASLLMLNACDSPQQVGDFHVIPAPQEVTEVAGAAPFVLHSGTPICYPAGNEKLARTAQFLASYIREVTGAQMKVSSEAAQQAITLSLDPTIANPEGYELNVSAEGIQLKGATEAAVFYGIQTLHKALPITRQGTVALPATHVKDYPQYSYRGFLVDCGRHFFSVDYLKEMIDMCALHNINHFHWHLTEDQGWRFEVKKYPKLTEIGSVRKGTIVAPGSEEYDDVLVTGYYTQEQCREIVAYAAERFIQVIPEVDMPGHMMAALASYPELGCTGGPYEIPRKFGVFDEVLCGGNEKTLQFAKDVLNEVMDVFPSEYIHIGGDECPKVRWEACPTCQAKIAELGLKDTKEHTKENQLQAWFMGEVEKLINERGRKMMAWDEILEGNPTKSSTVMAWTGVQAGIQSARLGHNTIICPITHLYFSNPGYNRLKGVTSIARVYDFEPCYPQLTEEAEKEKIIGVQGCIWTEWTKDSVKMEWQMMPRVAALCELQWTPSDKKDKADFLKRLRHQIDLYRLKGWNYKQDIEDVTFDIHATGEGGQAALTMQTYDEADIHYTTDGSTPTRHSPRYTNPVVISGPAEIQAVAVRGDRVTEVTREAIDYNQATMRPIRLKNAPAANYTFKGASLLNDGLRGDDNYRSGRYMGFQGNDLDATIDLQGEQEISSAFVNTYLVPGDYIFGLTALEVSVSDNGTDFRPIASKEIPVLEKGAKNHIARQEEVTFDPVKTRYVRIVGKITPELPEWHYGRGQKAFLFVDEIGVK